MRRIATLAVVTSLGLFTTSCATIQGFFGGGTTEVEEAPTGTVPIATDEAAPFEDAVVPGLPETTTLGTADLITSTDPDERRREITGSRSDPFALVPVPPPLPALPVPPGSPGASPGSPGTSPSAAQPREPSRSPATPRESTRPTSPGASSGEVPVPPITFLPPLPQPTTAATIAVTGVVRIGGVDFAIVDVPTEPTGRYVRVGDRLANGRVLVKRIETQRGEPLVIFEENGIELARGVGEIPVATQGNPAVAAESTVSLLPPVPSP